MRISIPFFLLLLVVCMMSCKDDEAFTSGLKESNLDALVQKFILDLDSGTSTVTFETDSGCEFLFSSGGFRLNGNEVTGEISIEVIEIFDKGTMAITGKHTMTEESILISGGEFFVKAYQGDKSLDYEYSYKIDVPVALSGTYSDEMQLFTGGEELNSTQDWVSAPNMSDTWGVFSEDSSSTYSLRVQDFQWFNCDRFYDDPRPLIELDISIPSQFNRENSVIYLAIKGEPSSLGHATRGKYPTGLEVHLIFISEIENQFLYQIISDQVSDKEYTFDRDKMESVTPSELKDIINSLE